MAVIYCPVCEGKMRIPDEGSSRPVTCPECDHRFQPESYGSIEPEDTDAIPKKKSRPPEPDPEESYEIVQDDWAKHRPASRRGQGPENEPLPPLQADGEEQQPKSKRRPWEDDEDAPPRTPRHDDEDTSPRHKRRPWEEDDDPPRSDEENRRRRKRRPWEEDDDPPRNDEESQSPRKRRTSKDDEEDPPRRKSDDKDRGDNSSRAKRKRYPWEEDSDDAPGAKRDDSVRGDEAPRSNRRQYPWEEDDEEDETSRSSPRDDKDPAQIKDPRLPWQNAGRGAALLSIGLRCQLAACFVPIPLFLISLVLVGFEDFLVLAGMLGLANWCLQVVGSSYLISGPKKRNLAALSIALTAIAATHLILVCVCAFADQPALWRLPHTVHWTAMVTQIGFLTVMIVGDEVHSLYLVGALFELAQFAFLMLTLREVALIRNDSRRAGSCVRAVVAMVVGLGLIVGSHPLRNLVIKKLQDEYVETHLNMGPTAPSKELAQDARDLRFNVQLVIAGQILLGFGILIGIIGFAVGAAGGVRRALPRFLGERPRPRPRSSGGGNDMPRRAPPPRKERSGFSFCDAMPMNYIDQVNICGLIGIAFKLVALLAKMPLLIVPAAFFWLWACAAYAKQKGHSEWLGLLGIFSIFGLLILVFLPDERRPQ